MSLFDLHNPEGDPDALAALQRTSVYAEHQREQAQDRARQNSSKSHILSRLKRGPATSRELVEYSINATARVSELRQDGWNIDATRQPNGLFLYELKGKA